MRSGNRLGQDMDIRMGNGMGSGTVIMKSYSSSVKYDRDGQPHKEEYSSQSMSTVDESGNRLGEKKSAYQNTKTREQKAAHEKVYDTKGNYN